MAERPRALFVAPSAYTLGGVQTWLDAIVPDLEAAGWNCTVALPDGNHHDIAAYLAAHPFDRWLPMRNPTGSDRGRDEAVARAVRRANPDVVVGVNIGATYGGAELARRRGWSTCRTAMSIHGLEPEQLANAVAGQLWVDSVVATNRLTQRALVELGGLPVERVYYAPYGVDLPVSVCAPRPGTGSLRIGWVGRVEQAQKRVHDLPDLLGHLSRLGLSCSVLLAGTGPEERAVRERMDARGLSSLIAWLGHVPRERMAEDVYANIDVLLVTSEWETGPIVAWEAGAHGVPLVSSRYVGSGAERTLRDDDTCLLFDIGDMRTAARQLVRLREAQLRQRLATALRSCVGARYSRSASTQAWAGALSATCRMAPSGTGAELRHARRGRLDRVLGVACADRVRRALRRGFAHSSAGGEWPHAAGTATGTDRFAHDALRQMDRRALLDDGE